MTVLDCLIDQRLYIGLPDAKQRVQIFVLESNLLIYLNLLLSFPLNSYIDFLHQQLVFRTVGFSGADIRNLVNEAAIMMLLPGGKVCYVVTEICKMIILDFCHSFCLCSSSLPIKKL
ncbi:hypothetical protein Ahy_B02g059762 [Arachis hypogaea]|uniref:AAA ATPase AAA+ lid domain-containing protein n=1 Tax=Arachis hypogaea TaxID=3818 RepID=A0A445AH61_ARAHY|nr:hypothetical protein Ahy_B02g059762 [Arachis hypogaea]